MGYEVIIAVYNGELYLKQQLDSIAAQSITPERIIIRDDFSTDNSREIIQDYKKQSVIPIVELKSSTNLGYIKNFEMLSRNALSDVVFFCDQDDIWLSNKAESLLDAFEKSPQSAAIFSDAFLTDEKLKIFSSLWNSIGFVPIQRNINLNNIISDNFVTGATLAIKRNYLLQLLPFPSNVIHDYWIATNAIIDEKLTFVDDKLIMYRQHGSNQIGVQDNSIVKKIISYYSRQKLLNRVDYGRKKIELLRSLLQRKPEMVSNVVIKRYILYFSFLCKIHGDKYVNDINCKEFSSVIKNGSTLASIVSYCRLRPKKNMITDIADFIFVNFIR